MQIKLAVLFLFENPDTQLHLSRSLQNKCMRPLEECYRLLLVNSFSKLFVIDLETYKEYDVDFWLTMHPARVTCAMSNLHTVQSHVDYSLHERIIFVRCNIV